MPIVPPTLEKIEEFLSFTERKPDEILGHRASRPAARSPMWATAVNGVMAGCRPEYMPILVALAEAMCRSDLWRGAFSGNTPGAETLIILNGPIIKELKFNYEQGVLRDGFQAEHLAWAASGGWRCATWPVSCLHKTDKGCFGNTFRVVLAENEDFARRVSAGPSNAEDMGFKTGDNTVTITRMTGGGVFPSVTGSKPEQMMPYISRRGGGADGLGDRVHGGRPELSAHCGRCSCSPRSWPRPSPRPAGASAT